MFRTDAYGGPPSLDGAKGRADVPAAAQAVHDIGNLIQIASSAINILARESRDRNGRAAQVVAGAQLSLLRARELVRESLDNGAARTDSGSVGLIGVLQEMETLVRAAWEPCYRFHVRWVGGLPNVACDAKGLRNAIWNLLTNAREAMPDGGDVGLAALVRKGGAEVEICVADNGVGMADETVRRALEPFFTTKADGPGGVGLASVNRFVREAGGRVEIASRLGVGTVVTMHLPAAPT